MGEIKKDELILANQLLEKQLIKFQKGFNILMEYWDDLPVEHKEEASEKLEKIGLN